MNRQKKKRSKNNRTSVNSQLADSDNVKIQDNMSENETPNNEIKPENTADTDMEETQKDDLSNSVIEEIADLSCEAVDVPINNVEENLEYEYEHVFYKEADAFIPQYEITEETKNLRKEEGWFYEEDNFEEQITKLEENSDYLLYYNKQDCGKENNMSRTATIQRKTKETDISVTLNLDGTGVSEIDTGIGFFNHMLEGFSKHGFFDLTCIVEGDLQVDGHHTVEDTGIVLGQAIQQAVGDKKGICRYGYFVLPMDDALALCAVDLCGRPYLNFECEFTVPSIGYLDTELIREFFYAVSYSAGMNLHIKMLSGSNNHHMAEAIFKAFAKALDMATGIDERIKGVLSTKGSL